ncbi:TauD/TfdA family dioxygenase [Micromonospora sp. CPCC 205546]|uniref:TauD/TfdA family dioxygenase n=1 Tax=Micromonospora sp. CPCC 205546 TaxID=3122397 RepID=UPI002FF38CAB
MSLNEPRGIRMVQGYFNEKPEDAHVKLREAMLCGEVLPPPEIPTLDLECADFPGRGGDEVANSLRRDGVAVVQFDRILSNAAFLSFGRMLGEPMPESHPTVASYVESDVILNLIAKHDDTADVSLQPFARTFLSVHSEGSGRPVAEQPRYIVLMCCEPGDDATSAQTALVSMAEVAARLSDREVEILSQTRYLRNPAGPNICRTEGGRTVFSFRDFMADTLEWTSTCEDAGPEEVNDAIRSLLAAVYQGDTAAGVHWRRGMMVLIDNTHYFHARTSRSMNAVTRRRHLKRLRIVTSSRR